MSDGDHSIGYDADEYVRVKAQSWRLWIELWSIVDAIRSTGICLDGARVGDFGSGTGLYTRKLIDMGAGSVLAIDGDREMIRRAREDSAVYNSVITYDPSRIQDTVGDQECVLAIGSYLMNYARTAEEALAYAVAISGHLAKGGIFIGLGNNPFERTGGDQYLVYGFTKSHEADQAGDREGSWVEWHIQGLSDPIRNFNLIPQTYEWAFQEAGMQFTWQDVQLHPAHKGNAFWNCFFDEVAPVTMMMAVRG
ncbi:MAG: methyltransferase domain-containing protein [Endozoicomonas sp.]